MYNASIETRWGSFTLAKEEAPDLLPGRFIDPMIDGNKVTASLHLNGTAVTIHIAGSDKMTLKASGLSSIKMRPGDEELVTGERDMQIFSKGFLKHGLVLRASEFRPEQIKRGNGRLVKICSAI